MNLKEKTDLWVDKNIISADQRYQILSLSHSVKTTIFICWSIFWLSVFCCTLGIIALIYAHWSQIPDWVKLIGAVILFFSGLFVSIWSIKKEKTHIAEFALFFTFFVIGGSIGLIAQIFNLPIGGMRGLLLWAILSFGIVLLSKRKVLAFLWVPLFLGGILGFMRLELLLLFFEQSPLFATTLLCGIFLCIIYLSHFFTDKLAQSLYHWSIVFYFPIVFLGDISMGSLIPGFLLSMVFLLFLIAFAVSADRIRLFNLTALIIALRILLFFYQSLPNFIGTGIAFLIAGMVGLIGVGGYLFYKRNSGKNSKKTD